MKNSVSLLLMFGLLMSVFGQRAPFSTWDIDKDPFEGVNEEDDVPIPKLKRSNAQNFEPLLAEMEREEILTKFNALLNQEIDLRDITNPMMQERNPTVEGYLPVENYCIYLI